MMKSLFFNEYVIMILAGAFFFGWSEKELSVFLLFAD